MKKWIGKLKARDGHKGFTIVELLVSITILLVALLGIEMSVAAGLAKLKEQQIARGSAECARIMMEFFSTVPPDTVYDDHASPGTWAVSNFSSGGYPALNGFVWGASSTCREYSDIATPIGNKVQMRYAICPSCVAHTEADEETFVEWTTCYYEIKLKISYDSLVFGGTEDITYTHKFIPSEADKCEEICGLSVPGEDKIYPCG